MTRYLISGWFLNSVKNIQLVRLAIKIEVKNRRPDKYVSNGAIASRDSDSYREKYLFAL